ncbi:17515_t:CDS:2 [Acaulospora morrowiae]|uniref:ATP-dependent RNA helicase n=1 Tax=Acaulospora morrowiae TaxID=94023 RepID=A0A9N8VIL1_9GLOM|nr:17515_t:CDS:2 [Acaulospora morrowiae]
MDDDKLILNLVFQDSPSERTSIRSKIKEVRGGWKEKNRIRRSLKKNAANSHKADVVKAENKELEKFNEKSKFNKKILPDNKQRQNEANLRPSKEESGTLVKKHVISSIFTYNPEIIDVNGDANALQQTHDQPSNAPVKGASTFVGMGLDHDLVSNMEEKLGVVNPTNIQRRAIPIINNDDADVVVQAETGSGKTLTYLLPVVHRLMRATADVQDTSSISRSVGTLAIILAPTRELTRQILSVINSLIDIPPSKLGKRHLKHWMVSGLVVGGEKRQSEKARLRKGVNILVSTPGRLLDHLQNTKSFKVKSLRWLVLDEADRLLEMGFEETLKSILKVLDEKTKGDDVHKDPKNQLFTSPTWPKRRQTILCSATLRDDVQRLAGYSLVNPTFVRGNNEHYGSIDPRTFNYTTPNQLKQNYVITPAKLRLVTLTAILKSIFSPESSETLKSRKIIVFLSCRDSVDFHFDLFVHSEKIGEEKDEELTPDDEEHYEFSEGSCEMSKIIPGAPIYRLHGELLQNVRTKIFNNFSEAESGILFCTDVAARGLDLPDVSKIIQYDPPTDLKDYVHRVGRTARLGKKGEAIIFLLPSEIEYIHALKSHEIHAEPVQVEALLEGLSPKGKSESYELEATKIQLNFEGYVLSNSERTKTARKAFLSYIRAYATHSSSEKHIFHIKKLHLGHVAKSFGLREAPSDINYNPNNPNENNKNKKMTTKKIKVSSRSSTNKRKFDSLISEFSAGDYSSMFLTSHSAQNSTRIIRAEIHDAQYYVQCTFSEACVKDFESQNQITLTSIKGANIIIREFTIIHHNDTTSNIILNITLEIKNFVYSTNIVPESEYSLRYICDDTDCRIGMKYISIQKGNPFENPGWKELEERINSMSCRIVPPDQRKILDAIPEWTDNESSVTISSPDSIECALESPGERVVESDEELSANISDEQIKFIRKGALKRRNEEKNEYCKRTKFSDED